MPRVSQEHLDARRRQIVDAARGRFASHGFARTSMTDLVEASGLSVGAIYRYFSGKDEIVAAICEETTSGFPSDLTPAAVRELLEGIRTRARDHDHARLVAQIYAEAAISPSLASIVEGQLTDLRARVAALLPDRPEREAAAVAEAFVGLCVGYSHQLAVRGDVDPAPFATALTALLDR
jgi:TetR/AcrR family transcriptional regulator, transcriptional repressor of aconitase